jgi:hypothetical protein
MLKAITLLQPWASLLAAGIKTIETRSWNTNHRGPLLIHASQKTDEPRQVYIMGREWMRELLAAKLGVHALADLPLGKIVGAGELTHAYRFDQLSADRASYTDVLLGNFAVGRFGLCFEDAFLLDDPVPARGLPNLWRVPAPQEELFYTSLARLVAQGDQRATQFLRESHAH